VFTKKTSEVRVYGEDLNTVKSYLHQVGRGVLCPRFIIVQLLKESAI